MLEFRNPNISSSVVKYKLESSNNVEIWEVTDPLSPRKIITDFGSVQLHLKIPLINIESILHFQSHRSKNQT